MSLCDSASLWFVSGERRYEKGASFLNVANTHR